MQKKNETLYSTERRNELNQKLENKQMEYEDAYDSEIVLDHAQIVAINCILTKYYITDEIYQYAYKISCQTYITHTMVEVLLTNSIASTHSVFLQNETMWRYELQFEIYNRMNKDDMYTNTTKRLYKIFVRKFDVPESYKMHVLIMVQNIVDRYRKAKQRQDYDKVAQIENDDS